PLGVRCAFQISIPEIGTITADSSPVVILTSNRTRELHDALRRRCLYHWIGYPALEREIEIVLVREPGAASELTRAVGPGDVLTYCSAMTPLDPTDLVDLYWAGRTTLVSRRDDIGTYDRVFRH